MGLRSLFMRQKAASGDAAASAAAFEPAPSEPLTPAQLAELQEAWAELTEAAERTGATSFNACSRGGKRWEEDPVVVRALAALLRDVRAEDTAPGESAG